MKSLRVSFVLAGLLLLSASTLSAQASKVSCKDGSPLKSGHFACWGHGGIVTTPAKKEAKMAAKIGKTHPTAKRAKKASGTKSAKAERRAQRKAHAQRLAKHSAK